MAASKKQYSRAVQKMIRTDLPLCHVAVGSQVGRVIILLFEVIELHFGSPFQDHDVLPEEGVFRLYTLQFPTR